GGYDLEAAFVRVRFCGELQGKAGVAVGQGLDAYRLVICRIRPPDETNVHLGAGAARHHYAPRVGPAGAQSDPRLADAVRRCSLQPDERTPLAYVRVLRVHDDELVGAYRHPAALRSSS